MKSLWRRDLAAKMARIIRKRVMHVMLSTVGAFIHQRLLVQGRSLEAFSQGSKTTKNDKGVVNWNLTCLADYYKPNQDCSYQSSALLRTHAHTKPDAAHKLTWNNRKREELWRQLPEGGGHTVYKRRAHTERRKRLSTRNTVVKGSSFLLAHNQLAIVSISASIHWGKKSGAGPEPFVEWFMFIKAPFQKLYQCFASNTLYYLTGRIIIIPN